MPFSLSEAYRSLNNSFEKEVVYKVGMDAGFFSEYNNMLFAMLYCLEHHIRFKLCAGSTNFNVNEGWNGFFLPFCEQVEDNRKHYKTCNWRYALKLLVKNRQFSSCKSLVPYIFSWTKKRLRTQDVFGRCRTTRRAEKSYDIPELGIKGNMQDACSKLIELTWRYNPHTQKSVEELIKRVDMPEKYIGFHIRGGDKITEHKLEPVAAYFNKVNDRAIKTAFVLTDDYSVIDEIHALYPHWDIRTLCQQDEKGYFFNQFLSLPDEAQQQQYINLFASMDILSRSQQFIGTYSSNPGMYLGMRCPGICTGVDFNSWRLW